MEMKVLHDTRDVEIWLTKAEKNDARLRQQLQPVYAGWKQKGYFVTVFESGEKDLYQGTLDLLAYNKKRIPEREVRQEREQKAQKSSLLANRRQSEGDTVPVMMQKPVIKKTLEQ